MTTEINTREQDELWVPDGYDAAYLEAAARADAIADFTAACERTVAPGQCTGCEEDSPELIPWSGQRLCWRCVDIQLDLLAKALLADAPAVAGTAGLR